MPTKAGPFNLGNVVVRAQITINPETAALSVTSDPFPTILDGIPLRLRTANVTIDRPNFIFNPTNCAPQHISADDRRGAGSLGERVLAVRGRRLRGASFRPDVHGQHLRQNL